jgi:hypothetical protein
VNWLATQIKYCLISTTKHHRLLSFIFYGKTNQWNPRPTFFWVLEYSLQIFGLTARTGVRPAARHLLLCLYSLCLSRYLYLSIYIYIYIHPSNVEKSKNILMCRHQNAGQNHNIKKANRTFDNVTVQMFRYDNNT